MVNVRGGWVRGGLVLTVLLALAGCEGLTSKDPPTEARVRAEVTAALPLELIVSTDFVVSLDPLTGNQNPDFIRSDTVMLTGDFEETYALNPADSRIFVRLANDTDSVAPVRLRVFLDGSTEYDASANLGNGGFLEYLFRFNQPNLVR